MREGSFHDGSVRDGSVREGSVRDTGSSVRDSASVRSGGPPPLLRMGSRRATNASSGRFVKVEELFRKP